jgi:Porin PorA
MRRIVSYVLIGLGVFAVALGLLLRLYAYPKLVKIPLDIDNVSVAQGSGVTSVLIEEVDDVPTPKIHTDLDVTSTTHVTGDLTDPQVVEGGDVAAWVEATKAVDDASGILMDASLRELCLDRHSAEAVAPCENQYISVEEGERITTDPDIVQQPGLSFKFPFGTEQRDYQFYDLNVRKTVPARFDGTETIKGIDCYRFVAQTENARIDQQEVPGSLIGREEPSVRVDRYYSDRRTMWVEPDTGVLVSVEDEGKQELVAPDESPGEGTTVYAGTLRLNDKTVDNNIAQVNDNSGKLSLLTVGPIVLWIVGGVLILVGVPLLISSRRRRHER